MSSVSPVCSVRRYVPFFYSSSDSGPDLVSTTVWAFYRIRIRTEYRSKIRRPEGDRIEGGGGVCFERHQEPERVLISNAINSHTIPGVYICSIVRDGGQTGRLSLCAKIFERSYFVIQNDVNQHLILPYV
jgi:hypothetical protein